MKGDNTETVIYSVSKMFKMLEKGTPNALEMLFIPVEDYERLSFEGSRLIANRSLFLSQLAAKPYSGYCESEWMKAMGKSKDGRQDHFDRLGEKRQDEMRKFGYCPKHAAHAIRLAREGRELLLTGEITFPLPYADFLLAIRRGEVPFSEIATVFTEDDQALKRAADVSPLPERPDREALDQLFMDMIRYDMEKFFCPQVIDKRRADLVADYLDRNH